MPMGKRMPQTEAWRNMCIQRMVSTGALAISSVSSSGCSWAFTAGSAARRDRRRRDWRRPRPRPPCQLIGEEGGRNSIMVTTGAHLLGKLSWVQSGDDPASSSAIGPPATWRRLPHALASELVRTRLSHSSPKCVERDALARGISHLRVRLPPFDAQPKSLDDGSQYSITVRVQISCPAA